MLDKRYHALPNDRYVALDEHLNVPNVDEHVNQHEHALNVDDVQYAPNDEPNDGRNDDDVDVDNARLHSL